VLAVSGEGVTIGEVVKVGADIKAKLELLARRENADAAWLARRVLRDWLERRSAAAEAPEPTEPTQRHG
jgi:predicted transcriptional regulator